MIFSAPDNLDFGVSGLLYNSDVLLCDRQSESLRSQIKMEAVSGARVGQKLELLPATPHGLTGEHATHSRQGSTIHGTRMTINKAGLFRRQKEPDSIVPSPKSFAACSSKANKVVSTRAS